jgi:hypothetical protein
MFTKLNCFKRDVIHIKFGSHEFSERFQGSTYCLPRTETRCQIDTMAAGTRLVRWSGLVSWSYNRHDSPCNIAEFRHFEHGLPARRQFQFISRNLQHVVINWLFPNHVGWRSPEFRNSKSDRYRVGHCKVNQEFDARNSLLTTDRAWAVEANYCWHLYHGASSRDT